MTSLRFALGISTILVAGCAHQWTGPPPGHSEPLGAASHAATSPQTAASSKALARSESASGATAADADPQAAADTTLVEEGSLESESEPEPAPFPEGTRSLQVKEQAHVRAEPRDDARYIGKITRGTRVGWKGFLEAPEPAEADPDRRPRRRRRAPCPSWVEIEPMGWLCSTFLAPTEAEPEGIHLPVVPRGKLTPHDYYRVSADETMVFATPEDIRGGVLKKLLSTKVMVVGTGLLNVDGTDYRKTDHGLIETAALARFWPSDFQGIDLRAEPASSWPFAWIHAIRGGRTPDVFSEPSSKSDRVRRARRREIAPVLEEIDGFVRIGDSEWIERKHLRVATRMPRPDGVGDAEQWIDIDLDEQVLVAYEGDEPVFATLVSTGKKRTPTPPGTYRVRAKAATTMMAGNASIPNRYEVSAVPWAVRFRDGLFIHAAYWHDAFGGVVSHGCVNVSPRDAAFVYEWVGPSVPDGWSEIEVPPGGGAIVRVRYRENPNPPAYDYTEEDQRQ